MEAPEIEIPDEVWLQIFALLEVKAPKKRETLKFKAEAAASAYFRRLQQDELGPSRGQRRAAVKAFKQEVETLLGLLGESESPIWRRLESFLGTLPPHPSKKKGIAYHLQWLRDALIDLSSAADRAAKRDGGSDRKVLCNIEKRALNLTGLLERSPEQFGASFHANWTIAKRGLPVRATATPFEQIEGSLRVVLGAADRYLAPAGKDHSGKSVRERNGRAPQTSFDLFVTDLLRIYQEVTGLKATYNPYRAPADYDSRHMRTPASRFAELIVKAATPIYPKREPEDDAWVDDKPPKAIRRSDSKDRAFSLPKALQRAIKTLASEGKKA